MTIHWSRKTWEAVLVGFANLFLLYLGYEEYRAEPELHGTDYLALGVIGALMVAQSLTSGDKASGDWLRRAFFSLFAVFMGLNYFVGEAQRDASVQWILLATVSLILVIGIIDLVRRRTLKNPSTSGENGF